MWKSLNNLKYRGFEFWGLRTAKQWQFQFYNNSWIHWLQAIYVANCRNSTVKGFRVVVYIISTSSGLLLEHLVGYDGKAPINADFSRKKIQQRNLLLLGTRTSKVKLEIRMLLLSRFLILQYRISCYTQANITSY